MYSDEIESLLESKKIEIGDRIKILKSGNLYEGLLMPRSGLGDGSNLVLKLDNGYNIGIKYDKKVSIKLVARGRPIEFKSSSIKAVKDPTKGDISILGCGGTIGSRIDYSTGAVFPAFSPGDLLMSFPELKDIANIQGRKLFDLFSEDMTVEHWKIIACEVAKEIKKKADGVVLMHGTDTMHYTSAALSFMLQNLPVPVVLVGAQRSSDRGSSDNAMNLISSVLTAAKSDIAEVSLCMHGSASDDFCYVNPGVKVRKMHTSRRDTFKSINVLPFAKVNYLDRSIEYLRSDYNKRDGKKLKVDDRVSPDVGLVYSYPGMKPAFVGNLSKFYKGIVIAGTGLGHVPTNPSNNNFAMSIIPALKGLISSGIPVVIAPQTIYGRLNMNVYSPGRLLNRIGVIGNNCDWTPETAFVKLSFVLGHTSNMDKIREMMLTNMVGEISERTEVGGFEI